MSKPALDVVVEDVDIRCEETFPDSGERCWCIATKLIRIGRQQKKVCSEHYGQWMEALAAVARKPQEGKGGL